jgi:hypothetical protein
LQAKGGGGNSQDIQIQQRAMKIHQRTAYFQQKSIGMIYLPVRYQYMYYYQAQPYNQNIVMLLFTCFTQEYGNKEAAKSCADTIYMFHSGIKKLCNRVYMDNKVSKINANTLVSLQKIILSPV